MSTYGLTVEEADRVYNLGRSERQRLVIRGHEFTSSMRSDDFDYEYYISVYGPDGFLFKYHHDESG